MWVFMLGFAGFPLTGGFLGKFYVFSAAYGRGWWWLVVIGVVATASASTTTSRSVRVDVHASRAGGARRAGWPEVAAAAGPRRATPRWR